ncbi:MAG: M1 family metallopeptidase, partial [Gillisia sp.]
MDFKKIDAEVSIYPVLKEVEGKVIYSFDILSKTDSIFIDAKNMKFSNLVLNDKKVAFSNDGKKIWIKFPFTPSKNNQLRLNYSAKPSQTMYFINWEVPDSLKVAREVWTQGQGRYTSYWFPSFDDMAEKAIFDLKINFDSRYRVISNGKLLGEEKMNDSLTSWRYSMKEPMSSYLLAIAAGKYDSKDLTTTSGVPLHLYYHPKDSSKVAFTYRFSKKIFDFLQSEIGYPYAWQNYKQVPVQDFLYSGMENTGTTIFSDSFMVDSIAYNDRNFINVNAHELAHQWFGDLVTETSGNDHWLQEGFATYFALLTEKKLFGDDYYYWKLFQSAEQLKEQSDKGKGEAVLSTGSSSLTYYQKGAWALHILREKIG